MTAFLAALVVLLVVLLYLQGRRLEETARRERAQLLDKITAPQRPMVDRSEPPAKAAPRRSKEQQREWAAVGTVARPRDPGVDEQ